MGFNAGVLLTAFDPAEGTARREDILGATAGPVRFSARPILEDLGRGVANCPGNARELTVLRGWDARLSGTLVTADTRAARRLAGFADESGGDIRPRNGIDLLEDFFELWLVFDYGIGGGCALRMRRALSTGGFRVQTRPGDWTRWPFEFTACVSLEDGDDAGFEIYVRG